MTRMSPSEAFVETLVANGVTDVFGIVGSAYMDPLDLFEPAGIRFWSVAHEQNAAHMADGYSRASGRHGVCVAQNGPGVTNFVTAIAAAYWAHSPVVCITPEAGTATAGLGGFQETEQLPIFSKITRYQVHVSRPDRLAELTQRAFTLAMHERGPAQINVPRDLFYGDGGALVPKAPPLRRSAGSAQSLDEAAALLSQARFPVLIAGGGVVMAGGTKELVSLAEQLSVPVVTSYLHNDAFPASHPLVCGPLGYQGSKAAMRVLSRADVVLALGTRLGPFGTLPQYDIEYWPTDAKLIQIDADHRVLGLVKPADVAVHGDARLAAAELSRRLREGAADPLCLGNREERLAEMRREQEAWRQELDGWSEGEGSPISPRRALRELEKAMPTGAMVATDIGNVCSVANSYLSFEENPSFFAAMAFGNCGYAFPTAMGAKAACPDRPSLAYVGDGAWGMSLAEMLTCVRERLPVVTVVFHNRQWGAEKKNQIDFFDSRCVASELESPSFAGIARAMGAEGITVEHPDQVGDALTAAVASGQPTVLELMLNQELADPFRRDALQRPTRLLEKYRAYSVD
jgi:sulfoacetaldehyde acetyltransferase